MQKSQFLILSLILLLALFFRTYQVVERFEFAHDGDLYSRKIFCLTNSGNFNLIIFELKHNFQQTVNFFQNFTTEREGAEGLYKFHIAVAGRGSPVYSIVIPDEYAF